MTPRPGGEADKVGNRYESRWTVDKLLDVCNGRARSITVEPSGPDGAGVEFLLTRADGSVEAHQVKRQHGNSPGWTLAALEREGVLGSALRHTGQGRDFAFISVVPCRTLDELTTRARGSDRLSAFRGSLSATLTTEFDFLVSVWGGAEAAYETLQQVRVAWPDEREIDDKNRTVAEVLFEGGSGAAAAAALGQIIADNLGQTLTARDIRERVAAYGFRPVDGSGTGAGVREAIERTTAAWAAGVEARLLEPRIERGEAQQLTVALGQQSKVVLLSGTAGSGKTGVIYQAVEELRESGPVLAISLDQIEAFSSTTELGVERLGLPSSPIVALANAAGPDAPSVLVVDQLDAVSLASGRMPTTFPHIETLIREASANPNMRVVLVCRSFDVDNDFRLRSLADRTDVTRLEVGPLSDEQVSAAVGHLGIAFDDLALRQKALLRAPLHLVLLAAIVGQSDVLRFQNAKDLFDAFYERKRSLCNARRARPLRYDEVLRLLAHDMSRRQRLSSPVVLLEHAGLTEEGDVLASENVLSRGRNSIGFFHEAFFDYVFARDWVAREQTVLDFLRSQDQELFRRAQVRQVLLHFQAEDPSRFRDEIEGLLRAEDIRFHIKQVVLALITQLTSPSLDDLGMVERVAADRPLWASHLWRAVCTPAWFQTLTTTEVLQAWLTSTDEDRQQVAIDVLVEGVRSDPETAATVLRSVRRGPEVGDLLRRVVFVADLSVSRGLFELVVEAVRAGAYDDAPRDLFLAAHDLAQRRPDWACELLVAWLLGREKSFAVESGEFVALSLSDHSAETLAIGAAEGTPDLYATTMVPWLLNLVRRAHHVAEHGPRRSSPFYNPQVDPPHGYRNLGYAAIAGLRISLRSLADSGSPELEPLLKDLFASSSDTAWWLAFEAMGASPAQHADLAIRQLLNDSFLKDLSEPARWSAREVFRALVTTLAADDLAALEAKFLSIRADWERPSGGYVSFEFLSAIPAGLLSERGRRRLGELQRQFNREQPEQTAPFTEGSIEPPLPPGAPKFMTDAQWLSALRKYRTERTDWDRFTGGARQLSGQLEQQAKADPERFVGIGLQLTIEDYPDYLNAILRALGEATPKPQIAFEFVRYVASLNLPAHDRWIARPLVKQLEKGIPPDIINAVIERAHGRPRVDNADPEITMMQGGSEPKVRDFLFHGMNSARGACALVLGDWLVYDTDGSRTQELEPAFDALASDPDLDFRACVAHLLHAALPHAKASVLQAFDALVDAPDELLSSRPVEELLVAVIRVDRQRGVPIVNRMLRAECPETQRAGGRAAAFAAAEFGIDLIGWVLEFGAAPARRGAAELLAARFVVASEGPLAADSLLALASDDDPTVRDAAAWVAATLRDEDLAPHLDFLFAFIETPAFSDAMPQLCITLEHSTKRVDRLVLATARRFLQRFDHEMGSTASGASADARWLGQLVLRSYSQAETPTDKAEALQIIDQLLLGNAYGITGILAEAER